MQAVFALSLGARYDRLALKALLIAPLYAGAFWIGTSRGSNPAQVAAPSDGFARRKIPAARMAA